MVKKGLKGKKSLKGMVTLNLQLSEDAEDSDFCRTLYFKEHLTKNKQKSAEEDEDAEYRQGRTLFVSNVPHHFNYTDLSEVFSIFGQVGEVIFDDKPAQAKAATRAQALRTALVVFEEAEDMEKALKHDLGSTRQPYIAGSKIMGLNKWMELYKKVRPDPKALQFQVDRFMEAFDQRTEMQKKAAKGAPAVDEDGFTLVTYKNKKGKRKLRTNDSEVAKSEAAKKKKKKDPVVNFYKFQERNQKMERLAQLRRKFEEDKQLLAQIKERREKRKRLGI